MAEPGQDGATRRLAVLIDGENATPSLLKDIMDEVAAHGDAIVRRVYGSWASPKMGSWQEVMHLYAFRPIQQSRYVAGKNAADIALIIDAMDLLYTGDLDGFAIVSSDSDYTPLVIHLREKGKFVLGLGTESTPEALKRACTAFRAVEVLRRAKAGGEGGGRRRGGRRKGDKRPPSEKAEEPDEADIEDLLLNAVDAVQEEDGSAQLGHVGQHLLRQDPAFDPRTYGAKTLLRLVENTGLFEIEYPRGRGPVFIRPK